jgi:hypothetical protein
VIDETNLLFFYKQKQRHVFDSIRNPFNRLFTHNTVTVVRQISKLPDEVISEAGKRPPAVLLARSCFLGSASTLASGCPPRSLMVAAMCATAAARSISALPARRLAPSPSRRTHAQYLGIIGWAAPSFMTCDTSIQLTHAISNRLTLATPRVCFYPSSH